MKSQAIRIIAILLCLVSAGPARPETLVRRWTKEFPKDVSWFVRTSSGILLVRAGKNLTALDGEDGRELWVSNLESSGLTRGDIRGDALRGKNVLEVPGAGIVLINRVKLPGSDDGKLVALNLMTGDHLWDAPQTDDLMRIVPLEGGRDVVLVSKRLDRKHFAVEQGMLTAASAVSPVPMLFSSYPFRLHLQRFAAMTGKIAWDSEYPRTFHYGSQNISALGGFLFIYYSNSVIGGVDLDNGRFLWEDGSKKVGSSSPPLSLFLVDGKLIYAHGAIYAAYPATGKAEWTIEKTGSISGLGLWNGSLIVSGSKNVLAADPLTGRQSWHFKPHGRVSDIVFDRERDAVFFADIKGIHGLDRVTGKPMFQGACSNVFDPYLVRLASPDVLVVLGKDGICAYDFKKNSQLLSTKRLVAFYRGNAAHTRWPMPDFGQELALGREGDGALLNSEAAASTLLSGELLGRARGYFADTDGVFDAYETREEESSASRIWWIDRNKNALVLFGAAGEHHEVDRPLERVFSSEEKKIWGSEIRRE